MPDNAFRCVFSFIHTHTHTQRRFLDGWKSYSDMGEWAETVPEQSLHHRQICWPNLAKQFPVGLHFGARTEFIRSHHISDDVAVRYKLLVSYAFRRAWACASTQCALRLSHVTQEKESCTNIVYEQQMDWESGAGDWANWILSSSAATYTNNNHFFK